MEYEEEYLSEWTVIFNADIEHPNIISHNVSNRVLFSGREQWSGKSLTLPHTKGDYKSSLTVFSFSADTGCPGIFCINCRGLGKRWGSFLGKPSKVLFSSFTGTDWYGYTDSQKTHLLLRARSGISCSKKKLVFQTQIPSVILCH